MFILCSRNAQFHCVRCVKYDERTDIGKIVQGYKNENTKVKEAKE